MVEVGNTTWLIAAKLRTENWNKDCSDERTPGENYLAITPGAVKQAVTQVHHAALETASAERLDVLEQGLAERGITTQQWLEKKTEDYWHFAGDQLIRGGYQSNYGFPIITHETLDWLSDKMGNRPLLEIGAGNGYLAHLMKIQGLDIVATEPVPPGGKFNYRIDLHPVEGAEVQQLTGMEAIALHPDRDLVWSWPDRRGDYVHETLQAFQGRFLIYIGENADGATGTQEFHDILARDYRETDRMELANFPGIENNLVIYERKSHPETVA